MDRREALSGDLRALADDLKSLIETATTDPKERQRKERRWRALYGAFGLVSTVVARRLATKAWGILTGETAPTKGGPPAARPQASEQTQQTERERSPARPAA